MNKNSCSLNETKSGCCSSNANTNIEVNLKEHWDNTYLNNPEKKLGWFETNLEPTLNLIKKTKLNKSASILNVGAGSTTLIDELLNTGYSNIIATDISAVALTNLKNRLQTKNVNFMVDDIVNPTKLNNISPVDLWIDRAVLHFFTNPNDQNTYFNLLKRKVKNNGFVIFAEYNLNGATKCAGLPVHRYSKEMLIEKIGTDFELTENFDHTYLMPSGAERPYIYTLFRKIR